MRPVGVQLYTLRRPFAADPIGTLERVRAIGYESVEFAAPLSADFAAFGARMGEIGLDCPSAHVGFADMTGRPDLVLSMAEALGCRYLVLPYVEPQERDWRNIAAALNTFAERALAAGCRVAYHHHDFEFDGSGGVRPFDVLLAETDPALVSFELDVYWLKKGGEDPVAAIERLGERVRLLHLKDMAADGAMTDVGDGTLDFPAVVRSANAAGVEHFFVEHDFPPEPYWPSVEASLRYLHALV